MPPFLSISISMNETSMRGEGDFSHVPQSNNNPRLP